MKVFYFVAWLVRKLVKSIVQIQEDFKERLRYRFGEGLFVFIGISFLAYITLMFPIVAYADTFKAVTDFSAVYWIVAGLYFAYMVLNMLYDKFSQEQEDFINKLKQ